MAILVVDDEKKSVDGLIRAMQNGGIKPSEIVGPLDPLHGLRRLYDGHCSALILDFEMEPGKVLESEGLQKETAGRAIWERVRNTYNLKDLPIILLSRHVDKATSSLTNRGTWEPNDRHLVYVSKSDPQKLTDVVRQLAHGRQFGITRVPPGENPNISPYFIRNIRIGQPVKVCFENLNNSEVKNILGVSGKPGWDMSGDLRAQLMERNASSRVYKVTPDGDGPNGPILGLYSDHPTGSVVKDLDDILCVKAPDQQLGSEKRVFEGINHTFAARFLRERIYEAIKTYGMSPDDKQSSFEVEYDLENPPVWFADLESLGTRSGHHLKIPLSAASEFLNGYSKSPISALQSPHYSVSVTKIREKFECP